MLYVVVRRCFVALSCCPPSWYCRQWPREPKCWRRRGRGKRRVSCLHFLHIVFSLFSPCSFFYNISPTISAADTNMKASGDISISDGSSEISGVPKDREKPHDISNHWLPLHCFVWINRLSTLYVLLISKSFDYKIYFRFGTFVLVICFFLFPCICIIARPPKPEGMKKLRNMGKPSIVQFISLH